MAKTVNLFVLKGGTYKENGFAWIKSKKNFLKGEERIGKTEIKSRIFWEGKASAFEEKIIKVLKNDKSA